MLTTQDKAILERIYLDKTPLKADDFFNKQNIENGIARYWNTATGDPILSSESLAKYEKLLIEIYSWNKDIYYFIHKGTPFYFCGIHSFDIKYYEKSLFYFDAAFSEDVKNKPVGSKFDWENSASLAFYALNDTYSNPIVNVPVSKIRELFVPLINDFSSILGTTFTIKDVIDKFVVKKIEEKNEDYKSIIPALYLFIYESEERLFQLKIRSDNGGTIEPYLIHLFKGCLLFESILKLIYPGSGEQLAAILNKEKIDLNFDKSQTTRNFIGGNDLIGYLKNKRETLDLIINTMLPSINNNLEITDEWIAITYALRNVSAHKLSWPDNFNEANYEKLYKSILYSILYLIFKKY